jgi:isopenicillin N synthase-like dioxygenase
MASTVCMYVLLRSQKIGANPHTDWGSFTILATDDTPGLQILWNDTVWIPVPPRPGCLIINSGDQIAQLANGVYKSALHRVLTTSTKQRFSTAVFTYFSMDCEVGPLDCFVTKDNPRRFPHRKTKDYFHEKLHTSMGKPCVAVLPVE